MWLQARGNKGVYWGRLQSLLKLRCNSPTIGSMMQQPSREVTLARLNLEENLPSGTACSASDDYFSGRELAGA